MKNWFQDDDVLAVDRVYRDCLELLAKLGIKTEMPHVLP